MEETDCQMHFLLSQLLSDIYQFTQNKQNVSGVGLLKQNSTIKLNKIFSTFQKDQLTNIKIYQIQTIIDQQKIILIKLNNLLVKQLKVRDQQLKWQEKAIRFLNNYLEFIYNNNFNRNTNLNQFPFWAIKLDNGRFIVNVSLNFYPEKYHFK